MKRTVLLAALCAGILVAPTSEANVRKLFNVAPGELIRWTSPPIGHVASLTLYADGRPMDYGLVPRSRACVAHAYGAGIAIRLTDCRRGKRTSRVRVRLASAAVRMVRVRILLRNDESPDP